MKRLAWTALLALAAGNAAADWVSIGDQGNVEVFVDRSTIVRSGDTVKMWRVNALKTPGSANGVAYVSIKLQDEYDCAGMRMRGVRASAHPDPLGEGKAVASETASGTWTPVTPQAISEVLWKIACDKE